MQNIREKLKRRLSHKDKEANFDEHDSADEETVTYVSKEAEDAERDQEDMGKQGSFLNRLIMHGNKKTEDQLAREDAERMNLEQQRGVPQGGLADRTAGTTDRQYTQQ